MLFIVDNFKKIFYVLLVIGIIFAFNYYKNKDIVNEPVANTTIQTQVEKIKDVPVAHNTETVIQYVDRPVNSNAQVAVSTKAPEVIVEANGKEYPIKSDVKENAVMENGQLKIDQKSKAVISVDSIVNEQMAQERKETQIKEQKMQDKHELKEKQKTLWGTVGGILIGVLFL